MVLFTINILIACRLLVFFVVVIPDWGQNSFQHVQCSTFSDVLLKVGIKYFKFNLIIKRFFFFLHSFWKLTIRLKVALSKPSNHTNRTTVHSVLTRLSWPSSYQQPNLHLLNPHSPALSVHSLHYATKECWPLPKLSTTCFQIPACLIFRWLAF